MSRRGTPYYKLYESILNLNSKIRFVTIIDSDGRLIFGGQKDGIRNYLLPEDQKKSLQSASKMWHIRNQFTGFIGKGKYAMAKYEKVIRYTIPLGDSHLLYITTEPDLDHCLFLDGIFKLPYFSQLESTIS
jgi:hypothetical protein